MTIQRLAIIAALSAMVAACGGGGGSSDSGSVTPPPPPPPAPAPAPTGTQTTPTYSADSAESQIFTSINAYRAQCGFPAYRQNTILDKAAANHAAYMIANGAVITDTEVQGNAGFTGVTGQDRANALGWPSSLQAGAADAGATYTNATLTQAQYGQSIVDAWSVGVYHQVTIAYPADLLGVGVAQTTFNGFPEMVGGIEIGESTQSGTNVTTANNPLTFPCQGVTGVPYKGVNEVPAAPNTNGSWGTPITVMGNPNDSISLTSATIQGSSEANPTTLNILTKANDTTGLIGQYQAVAYPSTALQPNTTYSVNLVGTVNGVAFTRSFTFTTGANAA
jgi:uncharacterized protein YkwD